MFSKFSSVTFFSSPIFQSPYSEEGTWSSSCQWIMTWSNKCHFPPKAGKCLRILQFCSCPEGESEDQCCKGSKFETSWFPEPSHSVQPSGESCDLQWTLHWVKNKFYILNSWDLWSIITASLCPNMSNISKLFETLVDVKQN
jgi:hypothetical protein